MDFFTDDKTLSAAVNSLQITKTPLSLCCFISTGHSRSRLCQHSDGVVIMSHEERKTTCSSSVELHDIHYCLFCITCLFLIYICYCATYKKADNCFLQGSKYEIVLLCISFERWTRWSQTSSACEGGFVSAVHFFFFLLRVNITSSLLILDWFMAPVVFLLFLRCQKHN